LLGQKFVLKGEDKGLRVGVPWEPDEFKSAAASFNELKFEESESDASARFVESSGMVESFAKERDNFTVTTKALKNTTEAEVGVWVVRAASKVSLKGFASLSKLSDALAAASGFKVCAALGVEFCGASELTDRFGEFSGLKVVATLLEEGHSVRDITGELSHEASPDKLSLLNEVASKAKRERLEVVALLFSELSSACVVKETLEEVLCLG